MSDNPRISTRRMYTGRIIHLDIDTVRFPNGSTGELEMIRHPGASAVIPFLSDPGGDDPQILLIRQYRYAAERYLYEVPAGRLDAGEAPDACARRELKEETGCEAERVEHLTTIYTTPGFTDEKIHVFLAVGLTRGGNRPGSRRVARARRACSRPGRAVASHARCIGRRGACR